MLDIVKASIGVAAEAARSFERDEAALQSVADTGAFLVSTFRAGGRVYSSGKVGSMCDALNLYE